MPCERLTLEQSRIFANLLRKGMEECALLSVYSLYLQVDDVSRATLYRWLSGRVRISIMGAHALVNALAECGEGSTLIRALRDLLDAASAAVSSQERLRLELRARRLPISRTIAAVRAARLLPAEGAVENLHSIARESNVAY